MQDFFFRQRFDFKIENNKVIFSKIEIKSFIEVFKDKFKEITGLEFEVVEETKETKKPSVKVSELVKEEKN